MALDSVSGESPSPFSAEQAVGPYLRAVRRRWIVVVAVTLLVPAAAALTLARINKKYQASASVLVTALPSDDPSVTSLGAVIQSQDPTRPVQTASSLVDTPQAAAGAAHTLRAGWTESSVLSAISVTPRGSSDVLAVTATASSPKRAAALANAFANSAIAYRAGIVQKNIATELAALKTDLALLPPNTAASSTQAQALAATISELRSIQRPGLEPSLSVSELAQPPGGATGTAPYLIILLALIGGFALGSVGALGLEAFSRPIRDDGELVALYPLPVLAGLPSMRRRRVHGSLPPWAFTAAAFEQMRMLRVQLSSDAESAVVMVTSAGAGDGKTTVAAALAAAFSEIGEDVIMMDLDLRRPQLTRLLRAGDGLKYEPGRDPMTEGLVTIPQLPGVKILPTSHGDMASLERLMRGLPHLLANAQRRARWVIIDTPPVGGVSDALRIAPLCEKVLFVARPRRTDRRKLIRARDLLSRAGVQPTGVVIVGHETPSDAYDYAYAVAPHEPTNGRGGAAPGARQFRKPAPERAP